MKLRNIAYVAAIAVTSAMIVLGTAGTSEAKGKKKMAAPPPPPVWCMQVYKPVCAVKGPQKMKFTYANACFASKDGAKVVSQGPCKPKAAKKAKKKGGKKKMKK